jgi:hypothetical protein
MRSIKRVVTGSLSLILNASCLGEQKMKEINLKAIPFNFKVLQKS